MYIYISGKIGERVISPATRKKFMRYHKMISDYGHTAFNPTSPGWQEYIQTWLKGRKNYLEKKGISDYAEVLRMDITRLTECDAIYMLPDFIESPGAKAEHAFAIACGKQVFYDEELYRDGTLRGKCYEKNRFPPQK